MNPDPVVLVYSDFGFLHALDVMSRDEKTLFYLALFLVIVFFIVIIALFELLSPHITSGSNDNL